MGQKGKGITGGSLGAYEYSEKWRKKQKNKAERFNAKCKKLSGEVRVRKMTPRRAKRRMS